MSILRIRDDRGNIQEIPCLKGSAGKDGENGADGVSATHSWNGTTLTITSASGTSSMDLKGDKGEPGEQGPAGPAGDAGYTPVRGTDYWTDADKAEIKSYIDVSFPSTSDATEGAFLRNVGGIATWSTIHNAEEASF